MLKFSIIIPTFNSEKYLEKTLKSIDDQTYQNYEVIICDNHSTDNTTKIISKFIKDNKRIKLIVRKDLGVADALNFGFENSNGDILCWLNSDDYYPSSKTMPNVLYNFQLNPDCLIVSGRINHPNSSALSIGMNNLRERAIGAIGHKILFPYLNPYNHPATFIAKKLYKKIGLYNTNYIVSADYELLYRAYSLGYKSSMNNEVLVSMEPGGFASQNKKIGRKEAYKIANSYTKLNLLPALAFILRLILRK